MGTPLERRSARRVRPLVFHVSFVPGQRPSVVRRDKGAQRQRPKVLTGKVLTGGRAASPQTAEQSRSGAMSSKRVSWVVAQCEEMEVSNA
jgi:hypothetical protein